MGFAERLRAARQFKRITARELAERAGINRRTLGRYESGDIKAASSEILTKLSDALGVSPEFLMGQSDLIVADAAQMEREKSQRLLGKILQKLVFLNNTGLVELNQQVDDMLQDKRYRNDGGRK